MCEAIRLNIYMTSVKKPDFGSILFLGAWYDDCATYKSDNETLYIFPQLLPQNKTKIIVLETDDFEQEGHTEMLVMLLQL